MRHGREDHQRRRALQRHLRLHRQAAGFSGRSEVAAVLRERPRIGGCAIAPMTSRLLAARGRPREYSKESKASEPYGECHGGELAETGARVVRGGVSVLAV